MTMTETRRFEMHRGLKQRLGDDVADSLMEYLPPVGWADVARRSDLDHLRTYVDVRFEAVDARFDAVDARFDAIDTRFDAIEARLGSTESRIGGLVAGMWALGTICVSCFAGIFAILITEL